MGVQCRCGSVVVVVVVVVVVGEQCPDENTAHREPVTPCTYPSNHTHSSHTPITTSVYHLWGQEGGGSGVMTSGAKREELVGSSGAKREEGWDHLGPRNHLPLIILAQGGNMLVALGCLFLAFN